MLLILVVLAALGPLVGAFADAPGLSDFYWRRQDWPVVTMLGVLLLLLGRTTLHPGWSPPPVRGWQVGMAAAALFIITWAGHYILLAGYDLSRDEQMVLFDANILARGQFLAAIPGEWSWAGDALNRVFTLPLANDAVWVSAYLPGNSALHALGAQLGDVHVTAPLLVAIACVALADIARRKWPDDGAPQQVALGTLLLSPQLLLTAMTTYAMSAHLALNLLWLALFLRDRWWSYGAALLIGFIATGLHQPIFHPLFVAPFLWWLAERKHWRALFILIAGYAAIGLFWLWWPNMVAAAGGGMATGAAGGLAARALAMVTVWEPAGLWLMTLNLLRFAAWQHLLLLPLAAAGVAAFWRCDGFARALFLGPILTIAAMLILLPYQGHGWGYRYLHGLIGNVALLAAYGWVALRSRRLDSRRLWWGACAASLVALAWLGWSAHQMVAPYAAIDRRIAASGADIVLIDDQAAPFAQDLVFNPPFLDRRPIRLAASALPGGEWPQRLCAEDRLAIVGASELAPINAFFGQTAIDERTSATMARDHLLAMGCRDIRP